MSLQKVNWLENANKGLLVAQKGFESILFGLVTIHFWVTGIQFA